MGRTPGVNEVLYTRFTSTSGEPGTPGNKGATIVEAVDAMTALGIRVIGLGDETKTTDPRPMLEAYAEVTGAVNNGTTTIQNGTPDPIAPGDPLYFNIDDPSLAANLSSGILDQMVPEPASMTGIVYNDLNDDGVRDAGEPGEQYRTVFIDFDKDGVLDAGEYQTQTDANGAYAFENLPLGEYCVRVVLPSGYGYTPPRHDEAGVTYVNSGAIIRGADIGIQEVTADEDSFTVSEDPEEPLSINVSSLTGDDLDRVPSSQNLVYFSGIDASGSVGDITLNGSTITYTPAEDWHGTDTFLYSLTDGYDYTDWTIVTVEVTPVNDAPEFVGHSEYMMDSDSVLTGHLACDIEGDSLNHTLVGVDHGVLSIASDGTFSYTPGAGFVGVERFFVDFSDGTDDMGEEEIAIYVCDRSSTLLGPLVLSDESLTNNQQWGSSVAADGDTIIAGSLYGNLPVFIYREEIDQAFLSTDWVESAELNGSGFDGFGASVAIRGDIAVVGAPAAEFESNSTGAVYVYQRYGEIWLRVATLVASDGAAYDEFGKSVAIDEDADTIVVGAPSKGMSSPLLYYAGAAYVFQYDVSSGWTEQEKLLPGDLVDNSNFGCDVDISGDRIIVGAFGDDDKGYGAGAAYLYMYDSNAEDWDQENVSKLLDSAGGAGHRFGCSVAMDGTRAVVGADGGTYGKAVVYQFGQQYSENTLTYQDQNSRFGESVDILADEILVGTAGRSDSQSGYALPAMYYRYDSTSNPPWQLVETLDSGITWDLNSYMWPREVALGGLGAVTGYPAYSQQGSYADGGIIVFPYNRTPAAEDLVFGVTGAAITEELFGVDPFEGDPLTFSILSGAGYGPYHGDVTYNAVNNTFTYTPYSGYRGGDVFTYRVAETGNPDVYDEATVTLYVGATGVIGRRVFYNNSAYDDNTAGADVADDDAIVVGKSPLLSSAATPTAANIIGYTKGINGVMVDLFHPADGDAISADDFECRYVDAGNWETISPSVVDVRVVTRPDDGLYDFHRVTLIFADNSVKDTWLEITVDDDAQTTGIPAADTFYFAHLTGDADGYIGLWYVVGSGDLDVIRANWGAGYTAPRSADLNGDGAVNSSDLDVVRANWGRTLSTMPAPGRGMAMSGSGSLSSSRTATPRWTAEADKVFEEYGIGDGDAENDLAIDEKFWEKLYKSLGLKCVLSATVQDPPRAVWYHSLSTRNLMVFRRTADEYRQEGRGSLARGVALALAVAGRSAAV